MQGNKAKECALSPLSKPALVDLAAPYLGLLDVD